MPVENPQLPEPPKPASPAPQPKKLLFDFNLPKSEPTRRLSDQEEKLWASISGWEGEYTSCSESGIHGSIAGIDLTNQTGITKGTVRLDLEKDPNWSVGTTRLVWKGTATLVSGKHDLDIKMSLKNLNPVFDGYNNASETGTGDSGTKVEGDVYLIIDTFTGQYQVEIPSAAINIRSQNQGHLTGFRGHVEEDIPDDGGESEEHISFYNSLQALPAFTDPDHPPSLKGKCEMGGSFIVTFKHSSDWELKSKNIKAEPGGPYSVVRGKEVKLDGSKSRPSGEIVEYEWTFESVEPPKDEDGYPPYQKPKEGAKKTSSSPTCATVILDDVKVKLKVKTAKGAEHTSEAVVITANPRHILPATVKEATEVKDQDLLMGAGTFFGANICSLDPGPVGRDEAQHYYHRNLEDLSWLDVGYKILQVSDSENGSGPFDGFYYLDEKHTLEISRQRAINRKITPKDTSGVYNYNENKRQPRPPSKPGSTQPHYYVCGCDRLAKCVLEHEQLHTDMILKAARGHFKNVQARQGVVDPVKRIEKIYYEDAAVVQRWADLEIRYSDMECLEATAGPEREAEIHEKLIAKGYSDHVIVYVPKSDSEVGFRELRGVLGAFGD
jgi:hypothetical protein